MLDAYLHWLGLGLCHQLPERSFFGGGLQAPVCARDTGIYVGFTVALILVALIHRGERPSGFPRGYVWAFMGLALAFMGWDGVSSYSGLRTTTNELRLLSGLGVGFSAAVVVIPMLNDELWRLASRSRVLDPAWRFAAWVVSIPATYLVVDSIGPRLGIAFPLAISICILVTLTAINLVIVAMLPAFDRRAGSITDIVWPSLIALAISFAEIALAGQLRLALDALARRLGG